jgi:hypothetical protein
MTKKLALMVACTPWCAFACAHAPTPYSFSSSQPTSEIRSRAEAFLNSQGNTVARETPDGLVTMWQPIGTETEVVGTNGDQEEPISDRRRYVIQIEPEAAGSQVVVRAEYETCPPTMPLQATSEPMQSCVRSWSISPHQQKADDRFCGQLQGVMSGAR